MKNQIGQANQPAAAWICQLN